MRAKARLLGPAPDIVSLLASLDQIKGFLLL